MGLEELSAAHEDDRENATLESQGRDINCDVGAGSRCLELN